MTARSRAASAFVLFLVACSAEKTAPAGAPPPVLLDEKARMDPASCQSCHPNQFAEWSMSMHAHSSRDPVFLAMNRRGQEATAGALKNFCAKCHAPLAVALGMTEDGLNLESLPDYAQGVTCYFCHSVADISADHNNGLDLADDGALRGPIQNPVRGAAHHMKYSANHDRSRPESSDLCGSCHDVVLDNGLKLERTALEWRASAFAPAQALDPSAVDTCGGCHMEPKGTPSVVKSPSYHAGHEHRMVAVDVPLGNVDPAAVAEQRDLVGAFLDTSLAFKICVEPRTGTTPQSVIFVMVENAHSGHFFPTGASQDRRVWIEVTAFDASGSVLYSSGAAAPDEGGDSDPDLWSFGDVATAADGSPAHMFWEIANVEPHGIPAPVTFDPSSPDLYRHHVTRRFPKSITATIQGVPVRVSVLAHFRPIGLDVLDDLVGSGHLDGAVRDKMQVYDLIPNRHLANDPVLGALATETFEWSDVVRNSGRFLLTQENDDAFPKFCVSSTPN